MAHYHDHEPERRLVVQDPGNNLTGFAFVKYGFILVITIVILYFLAQYILPLVTGR